MKVTKLGHCCMKIEDGGVTLLTDPGIFTAPHHAVLTDIDVVLYTHEHTDHFHLESLKALLQNNPAAVVLANPGVSALLSEEHIAHEVITDGTFSLRGVSVAGESAMHAEIHQSFPPMQNTGYFIANRLWYPGDAFHMPRNTPEIVALPIAGPWMKLSEAVDYALAISPRLAFPVHDFILSDAGRGVHERVAGALLAGAGITLQSLDIGAECEL